MSRPLQQLIPEIHPNQYPLLERFILGIIGEDDIDKTMWSRGRNQLRTEVRERLRQMLDPH